VKESALAVGIDLGGTQVRAALVGGDGWVRARAAARTDVVGGPVAVILQMQDLFSQVTDEVDPGIARRGRLSAHPGRWTARQE